MRMKKLFLFLLVPVAMSAQTARFRNIVKASGNGLSVNDTVYPITFPVVIIDGGKTDSIINLQIRQRVFDGYPGDAVNGTPEALLDSMRGNGLSYISYKTDFNSNGLLSLSISLEGCGAYCSGWTLYLNFDLPTGRSLSIDDVIIKEKMDYFKLLVKNDKVSALNTYKMDMEKQLQSKTIDKDTYNFAIETVNSYCLDSISISNFILTADHIEIIDDCEFPHVIRALGPGYTLAYKLSGIKEMIAPTILDKLQKK